MIGKTPPELKFFNMTTLTIAGKTVRALRHGMAGQPGWELFGPWDDGDAVREALIKAGEEFGLRLVGGRAYSSNTLESGWIPSPLPAIYTGDVDEGVSRSGCRPTGYEAGASIGGSFYSQNIEDYYFTPWDMGYGGFMKFDHDFIGREALREECRTAPHRKKVTLALDNDDVTRVIASTFQKHNRAKFIDWPSAVYSMHPFDRVLVDGKTVGVSTWVGYSVERGQDAHARRARRRSTPSPAPKSMFLWGEEDGGSQQADGRAPHADADARDRQPGAVCGSGAQGLRARRLARGFGLGASPGLLVAQAGAAREPAPASPHDEDDERDHAGKQRECRAVSGERHQ